MPPSPHQPPMFRLTEFLLLYKTLATIFRQMRLNPCSRVLRSTSDSDVIKIDIVKTVSFNQNKNKFFGCLIEFQHLKNILHVLC